jgi:hypothetical protein
MNGEWDGVAVSIVAVNIYQVETSTQGNIFWCDALDLCSKVSGILDRPASLTVLPLHPEQCVTGWGEVGLVTGEEIFRWNSGLPPLHSPESSVAVGDCTLPLWPSTAIRQQFLFTLLENCSFFAHLVLRSVRGGEGPVAAPLGVKPRPVSGMQKRTQSVTRAHAQRAQQNLSAVAAPSSPELETLWAEAASRSLRISVCEGGRR